MVTLETTDMDSKGKKWIMRLREKGTLLIINTGCTTREWVGFLLLILYSKDYHIIHHSPYSFSGNKVIASVEFEGLEDVWIVESDNIVHKTGPHLNAFTSEETAFSAWSVGASTPSQYQSYLDFQSRVARNPASSRPQAMLRSNDLEAQVNRNRHANPGLAISRGILTGAQEAPMVMLPEIAFARLGAAYQTWKLSRAAAKTTAKFDDVVRSGVNILNAPQKAKIFGAGEDGFVSIYRAPRGGTVDDIMKKGFDKSSHSGGDKSIYFGEESVAKEYAKTGTYDPYLIEVRVPKSFAEKYVKDYPAKIIGGAKRKQYKIPAKAIEKLNNYTRKKGGLEW